MYFERFGVIVFFGILIPGAYFTVALILALACTLELFGIPGHVEIFSFISKHSLLSSTAFFFIAYLAGCLMRLSTAPRLVDKINHAYYSLIYWKAPEKPKWISELFPYKAYLESYMKTRGMTKVTDLIRELNLAYGQTEDGIKSKENTQFFTYCKLLIEAHNETIAKHIRQNEALVRFLAGTVLALIGLFIVEVYAIFIFWGRQSSFFPIYLFLLLVSLITFITILKGFRYQRIREVRDVWMSVYLLLKGGIPKAFDIDHEELKKRVSMNPLSNLGGNESG